MRSLIVAALVFASAALAGCKSDDDPGLYSAPKPLDKMSNEEWCAFYARYLGNPQITPKAKEVDLQRMRERGCPMTG